MKLTPIGSNMNEVEIGDVIIFFSYKEPVACHILGKFYKTEKKWSRTTSKHITKWLNGAKAETKPQEFFDNLLETDISLEDKVEQYFKNVTNTQLEKDLKKARFDFYNLIKTQLF